MKVSVKSFETDMEIRNKGLELDVYDTKGKFLGDLIITKTQLIWCNGKTHRENGQAITWSEFITLMNGR